MEMAGNLPPAATPGADVIVAVILAAGAGTRFLGAGHKLDARLGEQSVLARAVDAALAAATGPVVVVTAGQVRTTLPPDVIHVVNHRWAQGQSTSLLAAVDTARQLAGSAIVVGLGDQPFVSPMAWRAVAATDAPIAVATYDGRRGHPVRLRQDVWPLLPDSGDQGARELMRLRPDLVTAVPCAGSPIDIDTVEDLRRWQKNSSTSSPSTGRSRRPGA